MIVVGIDPSLTNTGIAILADGHPEIITSTGIGGHDGDNYRTRSRRIRAVAQRTLRYIPQTADIVVIEGPAYAARFGNAFDRAGLWHGIYAALDHRNTPIAIVAPKTRASWATGNGNADKTMVTAAVHEWWPNYRDDITDGDRADALVLAAIGAHHHGEPMPFEPKPRHTTGLEAVQWPTA